MYCGSFITSITRHSRLLTRTHTQATVNEHDRKNINNILIFLFSLNLFQYDYVLNIL